MVLQNPYMAAKKTSTDVSAVISSKSDVPRSDPPKTHSKTVTPSASSIKPPSLSVGSSTKGMPSSIQRPLPIASKTQSALNLRKEVQALKAAQKLKLQQLQKQKEERKLLKKQQKQHELAKENHVAGNILQPPLAISSQSNVQLAAPFSITTPHNPTATKVIVSTEFESSSSVGSFEPTSESFTAASNSPMALPNTLGDSIFPSQ
jgi:hypothetical protein